MAKLQQLRSFEQLKILADARRLTILRLLMRGRATISQLGRELKESPAWVRHHVKQLEAAGLVEMVAEEASGGFVEKFYQSSSNAFLFQELLLPELHDGQMIAIIGSHDLALEYLAQYMHQSSARVELLLLPVGSLEGLVALRQGITPMTGCHLWDAETGEFNFPFVKHFFPDQSMKIITLSHRDQGLLVAAGNPHHIHGLEDLLRDDVTMINRNRGSGTRLLLERQLVSLGLPAGHIRGFERVAFTHTEVAQEVQSGQAVTGLGILSAARQYGLDFVPIFQERFDLVLPQAQLLNPKVAPILDAIQTREFRRSIESLGGYDASHTGEQWIIN